MTMIVFMIVTLFMIVIVSMTVAVTVRVAVIVVPARRFVHGNQHARQNALQHIDNCQPRSPAKRAQ